MRSLAEFDDSFKDRVDAYCDDSISDQELRLLETELIQDLAKREFFAAYVGLHADLVFDARARRAASSALRRISQNRWSSFRPSVWPSLMPKITIAAAAILACDVGLFLASRRGTSTTPPLAPPDRNVAWLVNAQDCQWADGSETPGRDMAAGKVLRLDRGLAEIEFGKGARVILRGPAALRLLSDNMARLDSGSLTARVPPSGHGFSILSPQGKVVDLGTEFGVSIQESGTTLVRVFEGELTASPGLDETIPPVHLLQGQSALIEGRLVSLDSTGLAGQPTFSRSIAPPPVIVPHTLKLEFADSVAGTILDVSGRGIGLGRRLTKTGSALPAKDPNLRLRDDMGVLELTTTQSDLNLQIGMDVGEYLGISLASLGFTGTEDFKVSAEILNAPQLENVGQFGIYAGPRSDRAIRGGLLRQPEADQFHQFLVNNLDGKDRDINEVGLASTGDNIRFTLQRSAGQFSFLVENLTRRNTTTLTIAPSDFLDECRDLDVGIFGANTQSDVRKTLTIKNFEATVYTLQFAPRPLLP